VDFYGKDCLPLAAGPRDTASCHGTWIVKRARTKSNVGHWYCTSSAETWLSLPQNAVSEHFINATRRVTARLTPNSG